VLVSSTAIQEHVTSQSRTRRRPRIAFRAKCSRYTTRHPTIHSAIATWDTALDPCHDSVRLTVMTQCDAYRSSRSGKLWMSAQYVNQPRNILNLELDIVVIFQFHTKTMASTPNGTRYATAPPVHGTNDGAIHRHGGCPCFVPSTRRGNLVENCYKYCNANVGGIDSQLVRHSM
jgi:hypothetical protein